MRAHCTSGHMFQQMKEKHGEYRLTVANELVNIG